MGTAKTRDFKIQWLISKIHIADTQGVSLDAEKLLNEFCLATSSTLRTAREILNILIKTNAAYFYDGDILGPQLYSDMALKEQTPSHDEVTKELDAVLPLKNKNEIQP